MLQKIKTFLHCQSGATAIEYGFIIALIVTSIVAAITAIGGTVGSMFNSVLTGFDR